MLAGKVGGGVAIAVVFAYSGVASVALLLAALILAALVLPTLLLISLSGIGRRSGVVIIVIIFAISAISGCGGGRAFA